MDANRYVNRLREKKEGKDKIVTEEDEQN